MEELISVNYYDESVWVTSLAEDDEDSHTIVVFRNLDPCIQLCQGDMKSVTLMSPAWDLV